MFSEDISIPSHTHSRLQICSGFGSAKQKPLAPRLSAWVKDQTIMIQTCRNYFLGNKTLSMTTNLLVDYGAMTNLLLRILNVGLVLKRNRTVTPDIKNVILFHEKP